MNNLSLVLLAAGNSSRFNSPVKKQWIRIGNQPLWQFVALDLKNKFQFQKIIIVGKAFDLNYMKQIDDSFEYVKGGDSRQVSLKNALSMVESEFVLVSDVARANISSKLIQDLIKESSNYDCISPFISVNDTTYLNEQIINRDDLKLIQTPQLSKTSMLKEALLKEQIFTDDSMAIKCVGGKCGFIQGETSALKITRTSDLKNFNFPKTSKDMFVGNGFDVHAIKKGDFLTICGERIPCEYSFIAHSDGDVAIHALIDAMFGACGLGDIGEFFPDTDVKFKNIDSTILLEKILKIINSYGFDVVNVDITIIAQKPKLSIYKEKMKKNISLILKNTNVNVKATTSENLGFTGRGEGIATIASVCLKYFNWKKL